MTEKTNEIYEAMVEETTALVAREDVASVAMINQLKQADAMFYSSIESDGTRDTAVRIYNAVNNSDESLSDHKNEELELVDVVAHPISMVDEVSGEVVEALRVVLITADGKAYGAVSQGVISSLQKIYSIVGQPSYNPPLKIKPVEVKTRKGFKTLTIALV